MRMRIARRWFGPTATAGELYLDDIKECFTLEDYVRPAGARKVPGETAIPAGCYRVTITPSRRFKRNLPILADVPGFTGIRIHAGNTDADTEGCILVGRTRDGFTIGTSRLALDVLVQKIAEGLRAGDVWLTIEDFGGALDETSPVSS